MNLAKSLLSICRLVENETMISQKYRIKYFSNDEDNDYKYSLSVSLTDTDRLVYIQDLIQSFMDENMWRQTADVSDEGMDYKEFKTLRGSSRVIYNKKTRVPESVLFTNRAEADEFYQNSVVDEIPIDTEPEEPSPEDDFFGDEEPEEIPEEPTGENPMTPEEFADAEEPPNPEDSVAPQTSSVGDSKGSVSFG